jgi:hypothetical protein
MTFVPWPQHPFLRRLEREGHRLRERLSLGPFEALDPHQLIASLGILSLNLLEMYGDAHEGMQLLRRYSDSWSAVAYREPPGPWLVTWNPWHSPTRVRASIMEEVAHIVLDHKPTRMEPCPLTGLPKRTYTPSKEKEAYGVAGAALVPFNGLVTFLRRGDDLADIAQRYGVSVELATMRANVTRARTAA